MTSPKKRLSDEDGIDLEVDDDADLTEYLSEFEGQCPRCGYNADSVLEFETQEIALGVAANALAVAIDRVQHGRRATEDERVHRWWERLKMVMEGDAGVCAWLANDIDGALAEFDIKGMTV